jgi:predicted transcriptional regulator of viral defense system
MTKKNIYLGPRETQLLYTLEQQNQVIFNITNVKRILQTSDASVKNVVYRLKEKHRIIEIERGKYLLAPAKSGVEGYWSEHTFKLLNILIDPYYVSYWTALHYWGMTDQIPRTIYVVTTKIKKNIEFFGEKIHFVTVVPKKFYGYIIEKIDDDSFTIATREKTIVDCLDHPLYCGGVVEVCKGLWAVRDQIDFTALLTTAETFDVDSVQRRLGYLLERSGLVNEKVIEGLQKTFRGFRWLDPSGTKTIIKYDRRWGLKINIPEEHLFDWRM